MWSGVPISWRISIVCCNPHSQRPWPKAEVDIFLELSCFFDDPMDVGNLTSYSSVFSKSTLNIRKFTVHVLLKPVGEFSNVLLENFEHYFARVWDDCNCTIVWAFFGIGVKNWPFPVLWPLLSFPGILSEALLRASSSRSWNSSAGIR